MAANTNSSTGSASPESASPDRSASQTELGAATTTLVVNPAFLQEMKDSNPDLWQTQHLLRQICHSDLQPSDLLRQLVRLLSDFRDQMAMQFALEDAYGYQNVLCDLAREPRECCEMAETAHKQHCELYLQLSDLAEQAEGLQYRGVQIGHLDELIACAMKFDQDLREHELLESDLIDRSFDL